MHHRTFVDAIDGEVIERRGFRVNDSFNIQTGIDGARAAITPA